MAEIQNFRVAFTSRRRERLLALMFGLEATPMVHRCIAITHSDGMRCNNFFTIGHAFAVQQMVTSLREAISNDHHGQPHALRGLLMDLARCLLCPVHDQAMRRANTVPVGTQPTQPAQPNDNPNIEAIAIPNVASVADNDSPPGTPAAGPSAPFEAADARRLPYDDCPICYESMVDVPLDRLMWCAGQCGQTFCIGCLFRHTDSIPIEQEITCPYWYVPFRLTPFLLFCCCFGNWYANFSCVLVVRRGVADCQYHPSQRGCLNRQTHLRMRRDSIEAILLRMKWLEGEL